jgi:hypothetical protein
VRYQCPVCGYPDLTEPPRKEGCGGSYEICPSCGFEFGFTDEDQGYSYEAWRRLWIDCGMPWRNQGITAPPDGWDPAEQLRSLPDGPVNRPL